MSPDETNIYATLLIGAAMLAFILISLLVTAIYYQRKYNYLYRKKIAAEITTMEKERRHIAANLHDDIGSRLALALYQTEVLAEQDNTDKEGLAHLHNLLAGTVNTVKNIGSLLWPPVLEHSHLADALQQLLNQLNAVNKVQAVLVNTVKTDFPLHKSQQLQLYRMVQELIANTLKHADAGVISVILQANRHFFYVHYRDDGKGFSRDLVLNSSKGSGMYNLMSRAGLLGGQIIIEEPREKGIYIKIKIPIRTKRKNMLLSEIDIK